MFEAGVPRVEQRSAPMVSSQQKIQESGLNEAMVAAISMVLPGMCVLTSNFFENSFESQKRDNG